MLKGKMIKTQLLL